MISALKAAKQSKVKMTIKPRFWTINELIGKWFSNPLNVTSPGIVHFVKPVYLKLKGEKLIFENPTVAEILGIMSSKWTMEDMIWELKENMLHQNDEGFEQTSQKRAKPGLVKVFHQRSFHLSWFLYPFYAFVSFCEFPYWYITMTTLICLN